MAQASGPQAAWCRTAAWLASAPGTVDVDYSVTTGHWPLSGFGFACACACTFVGFLFDLILTSAGGHAAPCFGVGLWVPRSSVGGGQSMAGLGTLQVLEASLCRACGQGRM